jgi:hypothetical protein
LLLQLFRSERPEQLARLFGPTVVRWLRAHDPSGMADPLAGLRVLQQAIGVRRRASAIALSVDEAAKVAGYAAEHEGYGPEWLSLFHGAPMGARYVRSWTYADGAQTTILAYSGNLLVVLVARLAMATQRAALHQAVSLLFDGV